MEEKNMEEQKCLLNPTQVKPVGGFCKKIKDPSSFHYRCIVLFFMCFLSFGSYFCYDNPTALHKQFTNDLKISEASYMMLYSWYSWPTVVMCFVGGYIIDSVIGVRMGSITCCMLLLIGQIVFATGTWFDSIIVMCIGRFFFGIGGETLAVAQNAYSVQWFEGKELNFVFGLQISMARIGSTVNMNSMLPIYNKMKEIPNFDNPLAASLYIASSTVVFSLICTIILAWLDVRAHRIWRNRRPSTSPDEHTTTDDGSNVIKFTDVLNFNAQLWLIFFICVTYYIGVFVFISMATVLFEDKFKFSGSQAAAVNSIVYLISAPLSPIFGMLIDRVGRHLMWTAIAVLIGVISHLLLTVTLLNPWVAMSLLGVSYSLVACALWPMVSFLVPTHQLGTAYGLMQSIQNLGLGVMSILAGKILDGSGLFNLQITFLCFLSAAFISTLLLAVVDARRKSNLNISAKMRQSLVNSTSDVGKENDVNNYEDM